MERQYSTDSHTEQQCRPETRQLENTHFQAKTGVCEFQLKWDCFFVVGNGCMHQVEKGEDNFRPAALGVADDRMADGAAEYLLCPWCKTRKQLSTSFFLCSRRESVAVLVETYLGRQQL